MNFNLYLLLLLFLIILIKFTNIWKNMIRICGLLKDELFKLAILGFALTEAIALFSLMMAFLILFAL